LNKRISLTNQVERELRRLQRIRSRVECGIDRSSRLGYIV
jgi:hypothetical protein